MNQENFKIQISYFASKAPKERKVSIAKWARFFKGPRASLLAPSNPKAEDGRGSYLSDLAGRFSSPEALSEYLAEVCRQTPEPILCCHEREPGQCHRSLLAEYLREKLGLEVTEWTAAS
jgi:hypothetical protein